MKKLLPPTRLLLTFFAALLVAVPASALADPFDDYTDRLDELAGAFGIDVGEAPTSSEPGFNRLVARARGALESAIRKADSRRFRSSARALTQSIALLDRATAYGAARNMSGTGHSDDLASYGVFIIGQFCRDLTDELAGDPAIPSRIVDYLDAIAETAYAISREAIPRESEGEYTEASLYYSWGISINLWVR